MDQQLTNNQIPQREFSPGFWGKLQTIYDADLFILSTDGRIIHQYIHNQDHKILSSILFENGSLKNDSLFFSLSKSDVPFIKEEYSLNQDLILQVKGQIFSEKDSSYIVLTVRDISDSRKIEQIVKHNERRLRSFLDASPDIFLIVDEKGIVKGIHYSQNIFKNISGKLIGQALQDMLDLSVSNEEWIKILGASHENNTVQIIDAKWMFQNQIHHLSVRIASASGLDSVVLLSDKTELSIKIEQIRILEKNSNFVEIVSGMNRELIRNIQSIHTYVERMDETTLPEIFFPYVQKIKESTQAAEDILKNLFNYSEYEKETFIDNDLIALVDEAISFCKYGLPDSVTIERETPDFPIIIKGPYQQLVGIMINIIMNSREAISQSGKIQIRFNQRSLSKADSDRVLGFWNSGNFYEIIFHDNGCGMAEESIEKIFDPLYSSKRKRGSTGMGLTILKDVMNQLHGGIEVHSSLGKGTDFHLLFPVEGTPHEKNDNLLQRRSKNNLAISLDHFQPLDTKNAISMLEGNEDLYRTIGRDFILDYSEAADLVEQYIEKNNWDKAHIIVHSIKGLAGLIGSLELQENARKYESLLKNQEKAGLEECAAVFSANLQSVIKNLQNFLDYTQVYEEIKEVELLENEISELDERSINELRKLEPHLKLAEYNESIEKLSLYMKYSWGDEWMNSVKHLDGLVRQFCFDEALNWLEQYI